MKLFLRPAVVGLRPARAQVGPVNGRNHSPIEYSLQTVVRVPLFAIFSQPPLPRFIQFPHSSRHLLLPFGTIPAPCCPSNPSPPFFLLLPSTSTFPMDRPQRLCHLIQPGDKDHSLRRSTPPATSEAEARGASTFHHGGLFGVYSQLASPPSLAAALVHFRRHDSTIVLLRENGGS